MNRSLRTLVAVTLAAFVSLTAASSRADEPAPAPTDLRSSPLTEWRVVAIAAREAPSVMASHKAAEAAEAERTAVDRSRLPDLVVTGRYTRLSSIPSRYRNLAVPFPDGSEASFAIPQVLDSYAARAAVVVPLSDAWLGLAASARALGHVATAKRIELDAARARAAYEARAAFLLYRRASVARRIAETALEVASAQAKDQDDRVRAGTAPGSSALTFEAAKNAAVARLRVAEAEVATAEANVRVFLPSSLATEPLVLGEDGRAPLPRSGIERSPELRAAEAAVVAADARVEAETLSMLPRLSLVAGAEVSAPHPRAFAVDHLVGVPSWDVTLQLDWALSSVTTGTARRERATAEREALRARAEEVRRALEAQRASAAAARASAEARIATGNASVATATKLAETRRRELHAGAATPLDVTNAEAERVRAELERADAELDARLADARLAYAAGYVPRSDGGR
ncbi:TolC family protein [Pendulispora albinea]|uniref:TolC family protein n=1 Tax=Pendulispora albinea TaxID=2741071 RepID=A0ABZ2LWI8_9BACT